MTLQIAIIGLNQIGCSLGLALSKHPKSLTCVGYDEEPEIAKEAVKLGAITRSTLSLSRCIRETRVIFLSCPLDEVKQNLSIIAGHAPQGTIVIDTSPNKTQVATWAQEILPEGKYYTGWTAALNPEHLHHPEVGIDAAREDLFENSYIGINDLPGTPEEALSLSSDLASMVGAKSIFIDSYEADGIIAKGSELPRIAALALILSTVDSSGWQEVGRLSGQEYAKATLPVLSVTERKELGLSMHLNQDNLIRLINELIQALIQVRGYLEEEDFEGLKKALEHAINQRTLWLEQRRLMSWDAPRQKQIERPSIFGGLLGSRFQRGDQSSD